MPINTPDIYIEEHNLTIGSARTDQATSWPIHWSAVWVGALAAVAAALLFGLAGTAVGAHQAGFKPVRLGDLGMGGLIFSVVSAFFSLVIGGWIAGKVAGLRQAETASLHGGVVWLVTVPMLLVLIALGAGSLLGSWYSGLSGTPVWASSAAADPNALMARNSALGAITALLIGLVGSVIGGWMASGEPMSLTYRRAQEQMTSS